MHGMVNKSEQQLSVEEEGRAFATFFRKERLMMLDRDLQ